jgi:hypothetical protein
VELKRYGDSRAGLSRDPLTKCHKAARYAPQAGVVCIGMCFSCRDGRVENTETANPSRFNHEVALSPPWRSAASFKLGLRCCITAGHGVYRSVEVSR